MLKIYSPDMAVIQILVLLMSTLLTSGQRPSFAGSRPIGYPVLLNKTTTPSALDDKFGEGTTQRLPIEAQGDRELIDRLSQLPVDKQPFWFINWQAYEANRNQPQTYPQRPNPFLEGNFQNTAPIITNYGAAPLNTNFGAANNAPSTTNFGVANTELLNSNFGATNGITTTSPGFDNINQSLITNPVNTGNVNTDINPTSSNTNAGQSGLNNKNGNSELNIQYATETTCILFTTSVSDVSSTNFNSVTSSNKKDESVESTAFTNADVTTKQPEAALVDPVITTTDINNKNISTATVPDIQDTKTVTTETYQYVTPFMSNTDFYTNGNTEKSEVTAETETVAPLYPTASTIINIPIVSVLSDTVKEDNKENHEPVKSNTNSNIAGDIKKPDAKVDSEYTNIYFPSTSRRKSIKTEDEYEDIEVKRVIKLYPGIIQSYQR